MKKLNIAFTDSALLAIRNRFSEDQLQTLRLPASLSEAPPQIGDSISILVLDPLRFAVIDRTFLLSHEGFSEIDFLLDLKN